MRIVQFLGYKEGGKTRAISNLTRALTGRGFRVGTVKHIHDDAFSIDTEGKDTWKHMKSGARVVVSVAPREVAVIRRTGARTLSLESLLKPFRENAMDYVLVEGYSKGFSDAKGVLRIVCSRSKADATALLRTHKSALCVIGMLDGDPGLKHLGGVPVLELPRDTSKVIRLLGGRPQP